MPLLAWRALWKDWGFANALFRQGEHFLRTASQSSDARVREGYIRASILFFLMAFEAYFHAAIRGYVQQNRASIPPAKLQQLEKKMGEKSGRLAEAVRTWPAL